MFTQVWGRINLRFAAASMVSAVGLFLIPAIFADASAWRHLALDQAVENVQIHPKDSSILYVTVEGQGILKTMDGGNHWEKLMIEIGEDAVRVPAFLIGLHPTDTKTIYTIGSARPWVSLPIKSRDGGESWEGIWGDLEKLIGEIIVKSSFQTIGVDPNDPELIYISDPSGPPFSGTYLTRNGGRSWEASPGEYPNGASWFAISPIDSIAYAIVRTPSSGQYITRSLYQGRSWQTIFGFIDGIVSAIAIDPTTGHLYAHGTTIIKEPSIERIHTGMYKSVDRGESWQSIDNGFPFVSDGHAGGSSAIASLAVDGQSPETIYAATRIGIYRSQNGGESWHPFNDGLPNLNVHWISVDATGISVYAGTDDGLFKVERENPTFVAPQGKTPITWGRIKTKGAK